MTLDSTTTPLLPNNATKTTTMTTAGSLMQQQEYGSSSVYATTNNNDNNNNENNNNNYNYAALSSSKSPPAEHYSNATQQAQHQHYHHAATTTTTTATAKSTEAILSSGILTLHDLIVQSHKYEVANQHRVQLVFYMMLCLGYFGVASTLFAVNNFNQDYVEDHFYLAFHMVEFWGALLFSLTEAMLFYANTDLLKPLQLQQQQDGGNDGSNTVAGGIFSFSDMATLTLLAFNAFSSAVAAVLFTIGPHVFEEPSHFIEYGTQITVTLVDYVFIMQSSRQQQQQQQSFSSSGRQILLANALLCMAIVKLFLYTGVIPSGSIGPERSSHYLEFLGEMMNSAWAFTFALQQYKAVVRQQHHHGQQLALAKTSSGGGGGSGLSRILTAAAAAAGAPGSTAATTTMTTPSDDVLSQTAVTGDQTDELDDAVAGDTPPLCPCHDDKDTLVFVA